MYSILGPNGQTYGPADLDTLKVWCQEGRIHSDTAIVDPIDGCTKRAADLPEVAQHIRPPGPPTAFQAPSYPGFGAPSYNYSLQSRPYQQPNYAVGAPKSKLAAILLAFFLGSLGIHRFYMGHIGTGLAMLLITVVSLGGLAIVSGIWAIVDIVLISCDALRDSHNRPLTWP